MKLRLFAILALVIVGLGAVAVVVLPSGGSGTSGTRYTTSAATRTDVVNQVVATGSVEPVATYSLAFGSKPTTTTASNASSASNASGGSTTKWTVTDVSVTPGATVTAGQELATADTSDAELTLEVAQANMAAAEARLATDKAGLSSTDRKAAKLSITQAEQALSQARASRGQTIAQNNLKLSQQRRSVTQAKAQLAADLTASPPVSPAQITQDRNAVTQATDGLASLKLQVAASNSQATNQVNSASNQVTSAKLAYASKTQGATKATVASDEAQLATAQQAEAQAQAALDLATLTSPVDGVVLAVDISKGVDAPSGAAITVQSADFQVAASVAETDRPALKLGQAVDITVTATKLTASGKVTQIDPAGSAGTGGGVVSYGIVVAMPTPPAGTASGMSAQVSIATASAPNVLAVPSIALVGSTGSYSVRVLDSAGQPQLVAVEVGLVTSSLAEIKSGIDEGTAVVVGTSSTRQGTTTTGTGTGVGGAGGFGGGTGFPRNAQP
jgi:multidrug efflux pump subunit AcrA (membrane-fusion protein)